MRLIIEQYVLGQIVAECEKYALDETGGKLLGVYDDSTIRVLYQIGPGPNARRTATSLFQDEEWQESEFRRIERKITNIDVIGSWHTHHVNGLKTLSSGDLATYNRHLTHKNWRPPFFLAILMTERLTPTQYSYRRFLLQKSSDMLEL